MNSHFIQFFTSLLEGFLLNISPKLVWMLENNIEFFGGTQIAHLKRLFWELASHLFMVMSLVCLFTYANAISLQVRVRGLPKKLAQICPVGGVCNNPTVVILYHILDHLVILHASQMVIYIGVVYKPPSCGT